MHLIKFLQKNISYGIHVQHVNHELAMYEAPNLDFVPTYAYGHCMFVLVYS